MKNHNGMNIVGQGGKIIIFTMPALIGAILVHSIYHKSRYYPRVSVLSNPWDISYYFSVLVFGGRGYPVNDWFSQRKTSYHGCLRRCS
ncbi:MAG: hypothetical protein ACFFD4_20265 [Candidatus Odinarchaeota archaeon]